MTFVVTNFKSESTLQTAIAPGTVETFSSESALDTALDALTTETITAILTKGLFYTMILDADFAPNTLVSIVAKGITFTVIEDTP